MKVIRALVVGVVGSGIYLTEYGSETEIAEAIQKRLQA
jgi:ABC-type phosphate transport system permease subunit